MGLLSSFANIVTDTVETAVDMAAAPVKAGMKGARKVAEDTENLLSDILDPFNVFHDK